MIYFDDLEPAQNPSGIDQILKNCKQDYDFGYRQFKVKIGVEAIAGCHFEMDYVVILK